MKIFLPIIVLALLAACPYSLPPDGVYQVGQPMEITTQLLCDGIAVDPGAPSYAVQGNPGHVTLFVTEPATVRSVKMTCYDMRGNPSSYVESVEWEVVQ